MRLTFLAALLALAAVPALHAAPHHPSHDVVLIYPPGPANLYQQIAIGYADGVQPAGLEKNVSASLRLPNGTTTELFHPSGGPGAIAGNQTFKAFWDANATGTCVRPLLGNACEGSQARARYTAFWNFTYITSAAGKLDGTCPAPPLAYESLLVNASFAVTKQDREVQDPPSTFTTALPSQPTGIVSAASAKRGVVREGASAAGALLALALLAVV
jgi:hypothetical protein